VAAWVALPLASRSYSTYSNQHWTMRFWWLPGWLCLSYSTYSNQHWSMHFDWLPGWLCLSWLRLLLLVSCWVILLYLLKPALEHAFWMAAWVALPLLAWIVIAIQLFWCCYCTYWLSEDRERRACTGPTLKAKWFLLKVA
jgi:hypothetical protein